MRRVLAILVCSFCFTSSAFAQPIVFPDNSASDMHGGLIIIRKGNQTTWSVGGVLLSRHVKVVTKTPEGKEITRFKMPSVHQRSDTKNGVTGTLVPQRGVDLRYCAALVTTPTPKSI